MNRKARALFGNMMLKGPMAGMDRLEDRVAAMPDAYRWTPESPERFEIMKEGVKRGRGMPDPRLMKIMAPTLMGMRRSMKALSKNPDQPKNTAPAGFLSELEQYVLGLGASSVGYCEVPQRWIFQNKGILHTSAIVLSMEMDKERMDTAPSLECQEAVFEIYRDLGRIANKGADYLRRYGYSAHAGHPLMGLALYPPLAQMAGLGWLGANGLIITPEHGPRVRLTSIFTSIVDLPFSTHNDHEWVQDYCAACQICVRKCPAKAIMPEPQRSESGQITHVINEPCFKYFSGYYGCSVCIAVCPFNNTPYDTLQSRFTKSAQHQIPAAERQRGE